MRFPFGQAQDAPGRIRLSPGSGVRYGLSGFVAYP
ncbi:hypothetical protein A4R44_00837 [Amycolatopsis sp. M39]|uniref:Uncharacterized protein n=1 Tax=Amycolatopsis rubida TaxID=112413 RepID=A0A1I6B3Q4_9PSEU|nr:hypothetical protein A4R44_00837 [Amycolatopsis sp. M39]SFQ75570.1 hypothetical protein SAMN05421854_12319 [Amycolatopsis rubida]